MMNVPKTTDPIITILTNRRIKLGLTRTALATRIGALNQQISGWEENINHPTIARLRIWAAALGYDIILWPNSDPPPCPK